MYLLVSELFNAEDANPWKNKVIKNDLSTLDPTTKPEAQSPN